MLEMGGLKVGMSHTIQKKVSYEDTTITFGRSGIETLLSTTALTGMMIEAAVGLVGKNLPEGYITVVKNFEISHLKPTLQGVTVTIVAKLEEISNDKLTFSCTCFDELGEVATGKQQRAIVFKDGLIRRAHKRAEKLSNH